MDGPPPTKRPRNDSHAFSSFDSNPDLSWNLAEINSELPDELNCQPVSNTKKAEDTIQKHHNLSQLLSAHNNIHPGSSSSSYFGSSTNPMQPRAAAFAPPQFRQQAFPSQLSHQPCPVVSVRGAGALPNSRHPMIANNLHLQNQMGTGFGPRQGSYGAMRPTSGGTAYVSNNLRNLNGGVYPYGNSNVVAMTPGGDFCSGQFPPPGGANDNPYCNQLVMGGKMSMLTNGSAVHRPCDDLKNTLSVASSGAVSSQTGLNSVDPGALTSKSSTTQSSSMPKPVGASPLSGVFPVSPAVAAAGDTSDATAVSQANDKQRQMHQLILIMHAHKCNQLSQANGLSQPQLCRVPECAQLRTTLKHMTECEDKKTCKVGKCLELRQVILHWKNCIQPNCAICAPVRRKYNAKQQSGTTTTSIASEANRPPPQPANSVIPNNAEVETTYRTLRLNNPPRDYANPASSASHVGHSRQTLAPAPPMSGAQMAPANHNAAAVPASVLVLPADHSISSGLSSADVGVAKAVKPWQEKASQSFRDSCVERLVQAIFPIPPDLKVIRTDQMNNLIHYAKKVEGDLFDSADSLEEYYSILEAKVYKIQKELEEKRMKRMMDNGANVAQGSGPPGMFVHTNATLPVQEPQFNDVRLDLFSNGPSLKTGGMSNCQVPQFMNSRFPSNMYNAQNTRAQSASSLAGYPDVLSSAGQMYCPMSIDSFPGQGPSNFANSKHDLPFVQQELICPPGHNQLPSSNLLAPPHASQQTCQAPSFASMTQVKQPQSPYQRLNGPSPGNCQMVSVPAMVSQSSTGSPTAAFPVNGVHTPAAPAMCGAQLTSPAGNFKMTVNHEDITDDEVTVKSEPRSPEDFKYNPPPTHPPPPPPAVPAHEDITDDEAEEGKPEEPPVEAKVEVKEDLADDDAAKAAAVTEPSNEVKTEVDETAREKSEVVEDCKTSEDAAAVSKSELAPVPEETQRGRKIWKAEELQAAFLPVVDKLFWLEEALPFREPVDAISLNIPDYHKIIRNPMDLSTIRTKLEDGCYGNPWDVIDDVNLMFDNAWLYNRKGSKVYKCCSKLAEVFEANVDAVMQSIGFCCGHRFVFSPQVLCCFGKQLCTIARDSTYYNYQDRYIYCEKCFFDLPGEDIEMADDPSQPGLKIKKEQFVKEKNDKLDYELFVECSECHRKMHKICVLHMEQIWPDGFTCSGCLQNEKKRNKYSAKRLPETKLSQYLEGRVNQLLKKRDAGAGEVVIRVMSSYDKAVEVKPGMKSRYVNSNQMPESFPYRVKAMFAFEEIDGVDVCFFGMHVQEYGSECHKTNARRVYIAYLDSVHYFQPRHFRTQVYHEILIGYMDYAKSLGYQTAHIWACPPSEGDDYIFHCHPPDQKIPKPRRLQEWYKKMLDKAVADRVVFDYKDIFKDALENRISDVPEIPYFEGDFWPNIMEDCIKELEQEELEEKRRREEEEAAADTMIDLESSSGDSIELHAFDGKKKGQKSGSIKKKNSKSKKPVGRKSKLGLSQSGNDLHDKMLAMMDKHKEGFFVIRLQSTNEPTEIRDPDPLINCDLMDGRDAFLTLARDKHYEFSSLRRAKYATMGLLYELHNQAKDGFVYNCNDCKAHIETRYHCSLCDDYDLCIPCYKKSDHQHKGSMTKLGLDLDDSVPNAETKAHSQEEARRKSMQTYVQSLEHASQCRDANCRSQVCQKMKRYISHVRLCQKGDRKGCTMCKIVIQLCCAHAKACKETKCLVPFCPKLKQKFQKIRAEQQFQQQQLMRRRMALMQRGPESESGPQAQTMPNSPATGVNVLQNAISNHHNGSNGGGKIIHGMPTTPPGAMMAARQAEQVAQRQAGMTMSEYQLAGMAAAQHHCPMMMSNLGPNHLVERQGLYPGGNFGGKPMSVQEDIMYNQHHQQLPGGQPGLNQGQTLIDPILLQQQQQQHSMPPTSKQFAMVVAKLKAHQSPQQNPEVMTMLKQNPQLMASLIRETHNQQSMPSGGQMTSGMNPAGHMMEGMLDDPGGPLCSIPVMPGMVSGQSSALADLVGSGQMRISSQWSSQQQQHQLHAMPPDYAQQFQSHAVMPAGGMYAGKNGAGALSHHMQRMRMNFGRGGPMHHSQPAYVGDDLMPPYGGHMGHPSQSQDQMQMMMQQRCVQARLPRMEMGARVGAGGMGQPMMLGMQQQRCATVGHLPVDVQPPPQHPPSFNCSLPSSSALPAQPGLRTHALGKMTSLPPRRPPPHYSDSVMMSPGGAGGQRTPMVLQSTSVRTDLNSYATAGDQARVRFGAVGANSEYCGMNVHPSSIEGLQHMKNPQRDMLSRFVNNLPQ